MRRVASIVSRARRRFRPLPKHHLTRRESRIRALGSTRLVVHTRTTAPFSSAKSAVRPRAPKAPGEPLTRTTTCTLWKEETLYRSNTSSSRIVKTVIMLTLVLTFSIGAATPAMALSAKRRRVVAIIKEVAKAKHYGSKQTRALLKIAKRESGYSATEVTGSCKGVFQLMTHYSRSKWANPRWNTAKAIRYIKHRYGTPTKALAHSYRYGWY
jgi:hypothetical protein